MGKEKITKSKKPINIHELECVKLFSTIYPSETDFVKTELNAMDREFRDDDYTAHPY